MGKRDFNVWFRGFRSSISDYGYYINFDGVYRNVDSVRVGLNILNSLIGSKNMREDFIGLIRKYPDALEAVPVLLAKRGQEIYCQDKNGGYTYRFARDVNVADDGICGRYAYFMEETGLFGLLENHIICNLVDYVTGVEVGLDSNGRKNRGGHLMENLVERYIAEAGFVRDSTYFKEMYIREISDKWGTDLSPLSNNGGTEKRFDFVVKTPGTVYAVETNFYNGGGSKLNETSRSYKMLAEESENIEGFEFVWFTDGRGWTVARNNLKETFDTMEHIYNISDIENGIMKKIFV